MKKLDTHSPDFAITPASFPDLQPASRLIVLVPELEADAAIAAGKIREAAKALESRVQLLGLSRDAAHEPGIRRQLVTLSAMIEDPAIFVESKVEIGTNWLNALRPYWRPGDVIVCFAGQRSGVGNKPLDQLLASNLNAAIYVLSGVSQQKENVLPSWMSRALAWTGSIGLILGFFWLQARIIQTPSNWLHTALLYASLLAEGGAIWIWNTLFS
ncbi:MAG: hypothetical protein DPW18_18715 [Chloroflexi bacterium]|nr:hypothetical protein [Chloroflexota bacterium]MDL1940911.1 hypothetical protein [Chloroflexi bacterium CFX2]